MSADILPTIKVIRDGKEVVINLSDYNPEKHKLAGEESTEPKSFDDMTATELKAYAGENNIDVTGLRSKVDLLAAVKGEESTEPTDSE